MSAAATPFESQARQWLLAFAASALVNLAALSLVAIEMLSRISFEPRPARTPAPAADTIAVIAPEMIQAAAEQPADQAASASPPPAASGFARTSPDQPEAAPERPDFIGERNTVATSDAAPDADAPPIPSQKGRDPLWDDEIETTQSRYQDGDLSHDAVARSSVAEPAPPVPPTPPEPRVPVPDEAREEVVEATPPADESPPERLAEGPVPVERRALDSAPESEAPKTRDALRQSEARKEDARETRPEQPKPAVDPAAPGFRGNQTKTRLVGSIARSGRSAQNVEDSLLGRYHAAVSRAVEREWQLNCVRNRDFITPGMLTMSFMLDSKGMVREVRVVEELQVGSIQKGFTLNAIHNAAIPAMPADLKRQLGGEPLELVYRFSF